MRGVNPCCLVWMVVVMALLLDELDWSSVRVIH